MSLHLVPTLPAPASAEPLDYASEIDRLMRELAAIGAPDEAENAPSENDKIPEAATGAEAAFGQQNKACEAGGAEECLGKPS